MCIHIFLLHKLFSLLFAFRYLYIYNYIGANEKLLRFTDIISPYACIKLSNNNMYTLKNMNLYVVFHTSKFLPQNVFTMPSFCRYVVVQTFLVALSSLICQDFCPFYNKSMPTKGMIGRARLHNVLTKCGR